MFRQPLPIPLLQPRASKPLFIHFHSISRRWRTTLARTAEEPTTLPLAIPLHHQSPASYGIDTVNGYLELIPPKTCLPYNTTEKLQSAFDYIHSGTFTICYRLSMMHAPVEIQSVELDGVRLAKKGDAKVKIRMGLGTDLVGNFTAQDRFTRSKVSVVFDGGAASQPQGDENAIISL